MDARRVIAVVGLVAAATAIAPLALTADPSQPGGERLVRDDPAERPGARSGFGPPGGVGEAPVFTCPRGTVVLPQAPGEEPGAGSSVAQRFVTAALGGDERRAVRLADPVFEDFARELSGGGDRTGGSLWVTHAFTGLGHTDAGQAMGRVCGPGRLRAMRLAEVEASGSHDVVRVVVVRKAEGWLATGFWP